MTLLPGNIRRVWFPEKDDLVVRPQAVRGTQRVTKLDDGTFLREMTVIMKRRYYAFHGQGVDSKSATLAMLTSAESWFLTLDKEDTDLQP